MGEGRYPIGSDYTNVALETDPQFKGGAYPNVLSKACEWRACSLSSSINRRNHLVKNKVQIKNRHLSFSERESIHTNTLGRSQAVRHRFLVPAFPGSNPGAPAMNHEQNHTLIDFASLSTQAGIFNFLIFAGCALNCGTEL